MPAKTQIHRIDDLYVPCEIASDDDPETPGRVTYWGYGYPTEQEAAQAVKVTKAGEDTPEGTWVDHDSGRRIR